MELIECNVARPAGLVKAVGVVDAIVFTLGASMRGESARELTMAVCTTYSPRWAIESRVFP